eukprot:scaffold122253_cov36-Phaeocystis_antarctica.AAC.1
MHRARPRLLVELVAVAHALRQPPPLAARVALRPELLVQPGRGRGGCARHRLCIGLGHRRSGCGGGCVSSVSSGSGCGRREQALELEVPRDFRMRAEALATWVEEVLVRLASSVAPAPGLKLAMPAVNHVARAAAALEVRCEREDPFILALLVLLVLLVLHNLAPAPRGVGMHRARPRLVELVAVTHALRQPPPLSTAVALRPELLGLLFRLVGVDSEQVGTPSWLPVLLAKRSGEDDGDMILRLPRIVCCVKPV